MSTHNLCFVSKVKVRFNLVYFSWTCFPDISDEEPNGGATEKSQGVEHESCTSFQTAVTTMAVLLAMLVIAVILCILIMLKWVNMKNKSKKASKIKKMSS